ncbi:MAG TPA: CHAD domain-containing protein [Candidatus Limnocylindrales bacterium]
MTEVEPPSTHPSLAPAADLNAKPLDPDAPATPAEAPAAPPAPSAPRARALTGRPGRIDRRDSIRVAAIKAMWPQVERLLAADATIRDPEATPDLKRYRVASRRLRAALRTFDDGFSKREGSRLRDGLTEIADATGTVRDLDVRIAGLTAWARERGDDDAAAVLPLQEEWAAARAVAARELLVHMATRRHERVLDELVSIVEAESRRGPEVGDRPIGLRAGSMAWTDYERLIANDASIRWADLRALHRARIEAKRLRYLLEFLGDLIGPERQLLVARLVALQDHLGALNDAAIAAAATRAFLGHPPTALSSVERRTIETYLRDRDRAVTRLRRSVGRPWRGVIGITFARRLARAVVRLSRTAPEVA